MNKNILLSFMLLCYLLPIMIVYYNYTSNNSVSNIICNNNCKHYFFLNPFKDLLNPSEDLLQE